MAGEKILIVDDEENILELIKYNLEKNRYNVITASNGSDALKLAKSELPHLMILDIMLPGMDGYDVCKEVRKDSSISGIPIIMISARCDEVDKILGLELGADDYLAKPLSPRELTARVKAILRRTIVHQESDSYFFGNISIDFQTYEVVNNNEKIVLSMKEFELLKILIKNKGRVIPRELLLERVWRIEFIGETRTVDVHIRHLRQKVEDDDKNPRFIETVRGRGYRFNPGD